MSEYLKPCKWSELRKLSFEELTRTPCVEIVDDDGNPHEKYSLFLMVPTTDYLESMFDARGALSNTNWRAPELEFEAVSIGGGVPEGMVIPGGKLTLSIACPDCGKLCKSEFGLRAHIRSHKRKGLASASL